MKRQNVLLSAFSISLLAAVVLAGCSNLADPLKKAVISFDESSITCQLTSGSGARIRSGTPISENTALYFTATPSEGKIVAKWRVNGQEKATTESFLYYANPKELKIKEGQTITVTFEEADAPKITLTFGEKVFAYRTIKSDKPNPTTGKYEYYATSSITSGAEVKAGEHVIFVANTTDKNVLDQWFVNGTAVSTDGTFEYVIAADKAKDADGKKEINVSCTEKPGVIAIEYDEMTIVGRYNDGSAWPWPEFKSGKEFDVGTELQFTATIGVDKLVSSWKLNDAVQSIKVKNPSDMKSLSYRVNASDAKSEGDNKKLIKVSFDQSDAKTAVTISYNKDEVVCYSATGLVPPDTAVEHGTQLSFTAINLGTTESVLAWYADTRKFANSSNSATYTVNIIRNTEAFDKVVVISRSVQNSGVTVTVDTATVLYSDAPDKVWTSGNTVPLTAKVPYGEVFEGWYKDDKKLTNGKDYNDNGNGSISYWITREDIAKGAIKFKTKVYPKVKVAFDDTVKVYKDPSFTELVDSGKEELKEGTRLYLQPQPKAGEQLKAWKINGYEDIGLIDTSSYTPQLTVKNAGAANGTITVSCEFKPLDVKKIKVHFDSTKINCEDYGTPVPSDTELDATNGNTTYLTFTVIGEDASKDVFWYVNGVPKDDDDSWQTSLRLSDLDSGSNVANVTYVVKQ